jgi:DnaJ-class molecular chaperone
MRTILTPVVHEKRTADCPGCAGTGYSSKLKKTCPTCNGTGKITVDFPD